MKLALDIGNSAMKGVILTDNNSFVRQIHAPSSVVELEEKYLNYNHEDDFYLQILQSPLRHFHTPVAIGQKAINKPDYKEFDVTTTSYKTNSELATSLLFGTIAEEIHRTQRYQDTKVKLAVSVPIVEYKALQLVEQYQQLLTGVHTIRLFDRNGKHDLHIHIERVSVMGEGQAGFLGLLDTRDTAFQTKLMSVYHAQGLDQSPINKELDEFLIVDIGEGTTDVAVFKNKKFNPDYSYSVTEGYGSILEHAIEKAKREGLTIESRLDLQKLLESTSSIRQKQKSKWLPYVEPAKHQFVETVCSTVLKAYGKGSFFDAILFLGGGFSALTGYDVKQNTILMTDNRLFNELNRILVTNNKEYGLLFGVPLPYAQTINERGLMQEVTRL